jgi:hypothetical protein
MEPDAPEALEFGLPDELLEKLRGLRKALKSIFAEDFVWPSSGLPGKMSASRGAL